MPQQKLTIVPVTLHTENENNSATKPTVLSSNPTCTIKTANAEISFFNGVDEHIIQAVMRELKNGWNTTIQVLKTFISFAVRQIWEKELMGLPHWFKILSNLIHMAIPFSYFQGGVKTAINVCNLMVMASPCCISVWIVENFNGQKMKMKYAIFHNRSFAGSLKGYPFSSQKPFNHRQKVRSKFVQVVIFIFIFTVRTDYNRRNETERKWWMMWRTFLLRMKINLRN